MTLGNLAKMRAYMMSWFRMSGEQWTRWHSDGDGAITVEPLRLAPAGVTPALLGSSVYFLFEGDLPIEWLHRAGDRIHIVPRESSSVEEELVLEVNPCGRAVRILHLPAPRQCSGCGL